MQCNLGPTGSVTAGHEEVWSTINNTGLKLTAGSRPRNVDVHPTCMLQRCEISIDITNCHVFEVVIFLV